MSEGIVIALAACLSSGLVAFVNVLPQLKTNKTIINILTELGSIKKYMMGVEDYEKIKDKFYSIQNYYVQKISDNSFKAIAILKSDSFIRLITEFTLDLDFDNINDYDSFNDHLCSASKFNKQRMLEILGPELTNKYYVVHLKQLIKYNSNIQKIFFINGNSKESKVISVSIDFLQIFMTNLIDLSNNQKLSMEADEKVCVL